MLWALMSLPGGLPAQWQQAQLGAQRRSCSSSGALFRVFQSEMVAMLAALVLLFVCLLLLPHYVCRAGRVCKISDSG